MELFSNLEHKIRNIFLAGILTIVPIAVTFLVLNFIFTKVDPIFQPLVIRIIDLVPFLKGRVTYIPGLGIVMTIIAVFLVGLFVKNILGQKLINFGEKILDKIPVVRSVYSSSKQFMQAVSLTSKDGFRKVILVEYPRKGLWVVGFVTCENTGETQVLTSEDVVNVFIPTTPNPTSGFLLLVPKKDIIPLSMTVEEGLKLVVSGGIVTPPR
jgi:uncharacterized membrane protein